MNPQTKSFFKQNLSLQQLLGFTSLFFLLIAIPITILAVGNPVSFFSEASSRTTHLCTHQCSAQGYKNGYSLSRWARYCSKSYGSNNPRDAKVGNCCCRTKSPEEIRNERKFGCVSPCQKADYESGVADGTVLPCSQMFSGKETTVIDKCCCYRKPLSDFQITDLFWTVGPKTYVSPALVYVGRGKYFAVKIYNASPFAKVTAGGTSYPASTAVKNVKLGLWVSCQSKWGFPELKCEQSWAKIENLQHGIQNNPTTDPLYDFLPVDSIFYVTPGASPRLVFLSSYGGGAPPLPRPWCPTREATAKFKVCADPDNKIKEFDETNNCLEKELSCDIFELEYDF